MTRVIRVPLAVDAQVRIRIGPFMFPLRSVLLCALASPIGWLILSLNPLPGTWRMAASAFVLMLAASMGIPMREGIWMGTWYVYQLAWTVMPSLVLGGAVQRARIKPVGTTVEAAQARPPLLVGRGRLRRFMHFATVPAAATAGRGLIVLSPGGARGIVMISGPPVSVASESYLAWCSQVIAWALALDCPLQFLTVMNHFDGDKARIAFEARTAGWPRTPLLEMESALAVDVAERTLGLRHYVVLCPGTADADGTPHLSRLGRLSRTRETSMEEAEQALQSAVRLAPSFGLDVTLPDRDDLAGLLSRTLLGSRDAMAGEGVLRMGDQHHVVLTMTQLPPTIEVGTVVEALMRTHARGVASLHILPVRPAVAQKLLHRRTSMLKYAARRGGDEIENAVALQDTSQVIAAIAQRDITPCRIALTLAVSHPLSQMAEDAGERLSGLLSGCGFRLTPVSSPCFLPALALSPGCPPLGRSLQLTSDSVALRMLPALGTPFSDVSAPLAGINVLNGAPAYFSIWSAPNHNLVVVGSSGAGKSVAAKTLLIRHLMEGASAVVIDPDSEYQQVMRAVGGEYFELGTAALNPVAAGVGVAPDAAASLVLPILSVMGGDEKGVRDGRPIRRLPDEDQGWLHAELAQFFRSWRELEPRPEPVMSDLVEFIDTEARERTLTPREAERCSVITARLRRYTQGRRADVFNRQSTFSVGRRPVAIGLRVFAMSYGADLTPALAVVLTGILAEIERREARMIVVVDEAHRVTGDPDAGEVLGQLVRQARKYGAGVWMCSQRVEDFVRTDLGRTLAATAATKLILGTEEAVVEDVSDVFRLRGEETRAINPMTQGRGVLLCGAERTVLDVVAGPAILAVAHTSTASATRVGM